MMSVTLEFNDRVLSGFDAEWKRVELLARCLLENRSSDKTSPDLILELEAVHRLVLQQRQGDSPWDRPVFHGLDDLALDVLACVYATEARPVVGLLFQDLQAGSAQPFPCIALIEQIFALNAAESVRLRGLTANWGELQARKLLELPEQSVFSPIKPTQRVMAEVMDMPHLGFHVPGAIQVREKADWDELVLPKDRLHALREYLLWLKYRKTVIEDWGGKFTGGPVALFSGPSGTGKSFAAIVVATELGWPLFRVDLASLVSKYIGETEKNLARLFDAAHCQPVVLLFDEVDALMSKRGEIKEARDRYANMEVSYLLARIEDHSGPCILTTNMRSQIDKAFSRRFQMVVEFPRPDVSDRKKLWQKMLPPRAPIDKNIDMGFLARAVSLTGGNIRNAALHAAYLAAGEESSIKLPHIAVGVWREMAKERMQVNIKDLGQLAAELPAYALPAEAQSDVL